MYHLLRPMRKFAQGLLGMQLAYKWVITITRLNNLRPVSAISGKPDVVIQHWDWVYCVRLYIHISMLKNWRLAMWLNLAWNAKIWNFPLPNLLILNQVLYISYNFLLKSHLKKIGKHWYRIAGAEFPLGVGTDSQIMYAKLQAVICHLHWCREYSAE